jgi:deoxyinosine 3'endonuclease (endonuclease V)
MSIFNTEIIDYEKFQIEKSILVSQKDTFDPKQIKYIGGLDISFSKTDDQACAFLSILDLDENKIIYEHYNLCKMPIEYVSGCLGLREVPEYVKLVNGVKKLPHLPQLLMVDGFGILHPRGFGSASHVGYDLEIPTIGVAKTLMCIDGLSEHAIKKKFKLECKTKGSFIKLIGNSGKCYGVALKTSEFAENPIYVSVGYGISLETSINFVNKTSIYKIPEPIRNSDIKSKLHFV